MKIIGDAERPVALELSEDDALALDLGIGIFRRVVDNMLDAEPERASNFDVITGTTAVDEFAVELREGVRFLTTPFEWYLARCALRHVCSYNNWALRPNGDYVAASRDVNVSPAQLFGASIDASRMLAILPPV